ncbi:nuclear transport factor 2 family protein [Paenibacillus caui]|uniref:nuclear transport factor 2 family protein n=1 Tax=Paenibacillus caui TaxID=2873927 RepID=UPI001CA84576|nr:nuclear transport factor 2 family protein [Paenibacillus caui]
MTILDQYFELSYQAGHDKVAFKELVNLFSDKAVVRPAGGAEIKGKESIETFYKEFFRKNVVLHHVWATQTSEDKLTTAWAVAGRRADGTVFALQGTDIAKLDPEGKIQTLDVLISK